MNRTFLIGVSVLVLSGCGAQTASCLDGGVDGGCTVSPPLALNPATPHTWDIAVDAFQAHVDVTNLSSSDGFCIMSGGAVSSTFTELPSAVGTVFGTISWDPQTHANLMLEFPVQSDATIAAQNGQKSAGIPLSCGSTTMHYDNFTYRIVGDIKSLSGMATMTSSMPQDGATTNTVGCPPQGDTCHVNFWFDNSPGVATTGLDLDTLLSTGHVVMPISGSATNANDNGETRSGSFSWSGTVTLRAVPR
jgi:hypothetical protein